MSNSSTSAHADAEAILEWIKDLSDKVIIWLLRVSSGFGKELTRDGVREQALWREQRMRNLAGLALRSRERLAAKDKSA